MRWNVRYGQKRTTLADVAAPTGRSPFAGETLLKGFRNEQAKPLPDHRAYDRDLRSLRVLGV